MNIIWYEKYRPNSLNQLKSQKNILIILKQIIKSGNINNNILFHGLSGTGKTSCIKVFAKEYYGDNYKNMILELNSSDNRGMNVVRNIISDFVKTNFLFDNNNKKKMVILDEVDNMTIDAQKLLIKLMENNKNVIFCFICNYINKIIIPIISRCLCFRFNKINFINMTNILKNISLEENIIIENENIFSDIYNLSNGDLRKSINIFQDLFQGEPQDKKIANTIEVYKLFNYPTKQNIKYILQILVLPGLNTNYSSLKDSYQKINQIIIENKLLLTNIIKEITLYINKNQIIKDSKKRILFVLQNLGDIENNLTEDYSHKIQLYALISIFKIKI